MTVSQRGFLKSMAREALVAFAVIGTTACNSPAPSPTPPRTEATPVVGMTLPPASTGSIQPGPAPSIEVQDADVSLRASLDKSAIRPGQVVVATVAVTNRSLNPLHYPGGKEPSCRYGGDFWFDFPTPVLPRGRVWIGDRQVVKDMLFGVYPGSLQLGREGRSGCDATGIPDVIAPNTTVEVSQSWDGRYGDGFPASPATYQLNLRFVLFRPPDDAFEPVMTTLPVVLLPGESPIAPTMAVDVALADEEVARWLADHPVSTWAARPALEYRPETADFELTLVEAEGARLRATVANDGRGPVNVRLDVDPTNEPEPTRAA